ncbi:exosortase A [Chromatium okenii]|uniref:exosortase A n=1 Tax=Chromatium okenii TaxID=61644 RepID=UPI0026EEFEA5|nr:exosortase A [Chromatium okenii]MBV5307936.1 exosortase A [Chromatium okenii]
MNNTIKAVNYQSIAWIKLIELNLLLAILLTLLWSSYADIVHIWWRSQTFTHGFLVVPIAIYLIWRKRLEIKKITLKTEPLAIPLIALTGLTWLLARLTEVAVVEQFTAVALIPLIFWLTLGTAAARVLTFPLGFLIFAVPMGEALVDPLMQFTAAFTVMLLRLTGLPVFWDGTFFSIPSGDWSVVAACSGIRYLIASLFLGTLYAYINYRTLWRRMLFIILSGVVPIFANGFRAYLIVMIGHLSGMKLAVGVDHLIYGWVFFGIIMFLLFALGNLWMESPLSTIPNNTTLDSELPSTITAEPLKRSAALLVLGLISFAVWPLLDTWLQRPQSAPIDFAFTLPTGQDHWQVRTDTFTDWTPRYLDATLEMRRDFEDQTNATTAPVGCYFAFYSNAQGELVNSENVMVSQNHPLWRMPSHRIIQLSIAGNDMTVIESRVHSDSQTLLVWHWHWIDGYVTANDYVAKIYQLFAIVTGHAYRQVGVVFYTTITDNKQDAAHQQLQRFANDMLPVINARLHEMP